MHPVLTDVISVVSRIDDVGVVQLSGSFKLLNHDLDRSVDRL